MKDLKVLLKLSVPDDVSPTEVFHKAQDLIAAGTDWELLGGFAVLADAQMEPLEPCVMITADKWRRLGHPDSTEATNGS